MKHIREYTWVGVEVSVNSIAMQMFKDEWRPDYIVGITRGGLVPAVLLSHATDIPMKTLCVQLESDGLEENTERNPLMARDALKNNKKILILDDINRGGDAGIPCRAVFIIDPTRTVRHITMNDPPVGRNVDETLRLVKGYQYTDEHGEVCPANWTPGDATMVADPKKSKEGYFSKMHK